MFATARDRLWGCFVVYTGTAESATIWLVPSSVVVVMVVAPLLSASLLPCGAGMLPGQTLLDMAGALGFII